MTMNTSSSTPKEPQVPVRPFRILVVDDNDASAKTMAWTLEFLGQEVHIAYLGKQAVEMAESLLPEIVMLDIGLPDINGYEVCKLMRHMPGLEHTIFIAQTGWSEEEDFQRSKEAGFSHHLVKPINMAKLQELLANLTEQNPDGKTSTPTS
jgi:CheY-like chemotaxis protein